MKPPTLRDLRTLTELGAPLEIAIEPRGKPGRRSVFRFPASALLVWVPSASALLAIVGATRGDPRPVPKGSEAAKTRKKWTGRTPAGAYALTLPDLGGRWRDLGTAKRTDYASAKWSRAGKITEYTHDHGPGVRVWMRGNPIAGAGALALAGGTLRITARGIEG